MIAAPAGVFALGDYAGASYDELCRKRFGRVYDLESTVRRFSALRSPGRPLTASDVVELFDPDRTHFGHFWRPPQDLALNSRGISLARPEQPNKQWREDVVAALFKFLGCVDPVSVVLRCIHPEDFAVYSPPILNLLQLPAEPPVEHYLTYCDELRTWGAHFGTDGVAKTDQALWVFYETAYGPACVKDAGILRRAFENNRWVRERQARIRFRALRHDANACREGERSPLMARLLHARPVAARYRCADDRARHPRN